MSWVRHPLPRDAAIAAALVVVLLVTAEIDDAPPGISFVGVLATLLLCAPVAVRSLAPIPALVVTIAGVFAVLATTKAYETVVVPALFALFTVAATGDRRRSLLVGATMVPVVLLAVALFSPHGLLNHEAAMNLAFCCLALVAGDAVRSRCAFVAATRERAEREQLAREEEARRRVSEERLRIARELHDVVAHSMVAINVQAGVAAHLAGRDPEAAREALARIKDASSEALADLRGTLGVLREEDVAAPTRPAQGIGALGELASSVRAAGVDVELDVRAGTRHVPVAVDAAAHRIVQEALTNVLRHAGAATVTVRIDVRPEAVELEVLDDGQGSEASPGQAPQGSGRGVQGMRERAASLGGSVEAGRREAGGWRVHALLPLSS